MIYNSLNHFTKRDHKIRNENVIFGIKAFVSTMKLLKMNVENSAKHFTL